MDSSTGMVRRKAWTLFGCYAAAFLLGIAGNIVYEGPERERLGNLRRAAAHGHAGPLSPIEIEAVYRAAGREPPAKEYCDGSFTDLTPELQQRALKGLGGR